jgi:hypothetical protein
MLQNLGINSNGSRVELTAFGPIETLGQILQGPPASGAQ